MKKASADAIKKIEALGKVAKPINDDDWGSDRQIDAENKFFEAVQKVVSKKVFEGLEGYCLKATSYEMVDAGIEAVKGLNDFSIWLPGGKGPRHSIVEGKDK